MRLQLYEFVIPVSVIYQQKLTQSYFILNSHLYWLGMVSSDNVNSLATLKMFYNQL